MLEHFRQQTWQENRGKPAARSALMLPIDKANAEQHLRIAA